MPPFVGEGGRRHRGHRAHVAAPAQHVLLRRGQLQPALDALHVGPEDLGPAVLLLTVAILRYRVVSDPHQQAA